ncbi:saccharopine dehydrogenase-like protein [Haloactinopolyspora alba]|uniref:Saccharopine dehydrogenase-like protein n=1 Tax=Haloactinopolyspora alba TaxID=648780 RepID=A0A2P8EBI8_9ACTN|nr:saccharopine dehydrogenase NADP-binding domain-containing protein [Haloactinopolyspora alba]PSL06822.1 saccharopine dehydrogenase-like protein [Haloactinopolyspora alba]
MNEDVLVYGAYGHTGRFVVAELLRRGFSPVLSGRDPAALKDLGSQHPGLDVRPAAVDDDRALDAAMRGVAAVVNCAGPFLDTAVPVAKTAIEAGAHYLDISAEQAAAQQIYDSHDRRAQHAGVAAVPAMAFYGGLADLLATAAAADWDAMDEIVVAIGIDRWWPTIGTRNTGRRNTATRLVVEGGQLVPAPTTAPVRDWEFPEPLGRRTVIGAPFTEVISVARHLNVSSVRTYLASDALDDIHDSGTPAPQAIDETGRSAQRFVVDVTVCRGRAQRRISAGGRDIYAVTAPLVVEAVQRLLDGRAVIRGAAAPGETFDARDFLEALTPDHLTLSTRDVDVECARTG